MADDKMKCPLLLAGEYNITWDKRNDCLKKCCAWWQPLNEECAVKGLADAVLEVKGELLLARFKRTEGGK